MNKNNFFNLKKYIFAPLIRKAHKQAGVAKLVDALDLGSSAERRGGSSPSTRTKDFLDPQKVYASSCTLFFYPL